MRLGGLGLGVGVLRKLAAASAVTLTIVGSASVNTAGQVTYTVSNGTGTGLVWSLTSSPSGGSINSSTGAYTAGDAGKGVTDVLHVVDSGGNAGSLNVTVNSALPSDVTWTLKTDARDLVSAGGTDGSTVNTWAGGGSVAASWQKVTTGPTLKTNIINGQPVVRFGNAAAQTMQLDSSKKWGDLALNSTHTIIGVGINNANHTHSGASTSADECWIATANGYFALSQSNSAGSIFGIYNWDGNEDHVLAAGTTGAAVLLIERLSGGVAGLQVGSAGTEVTVATGNTQDVTGIVNLGAGSAIRMNGDIAFLAMTKASLTSSQKARAIDYVQSIWGGSL